MLQLIKKRSNFLRGIALCCLGLFWANLLYAEKEKYQEKQQDEAKSQYLLTPLFKEFDGYSYFRIGLEELTYQEQTKAINPTTGERARLNSEAKSTSPTYLSGGIVKFSKTWDMSYDLISTLLPNEVKEKWRSRGNIVQKNRFTLLTSSMMFLAHYKITQKHRFVVGGSYYFFTFKRFDFSTSEDAPTLEETSASLLLNIGYWFESKPVGVLGTHVSYNLVFGQPLWQRTTNTLVPGIEFTNGQGYNLKSDANIAFTVGEGIEVGGFVGLDFILREGETKRLKEPVAAGSRTNSEGETETIVLEKVTWPKNETSFFRVGVGVNWKFR